MAARDDYNTIIITPEPKGRFVGGICGAAIRPGVVCQIKAATAKINGRFTYELYNRAADGDRPGGPLWVSVDNNLVGGTIDTTWNSGDLAWFYCPLPGDELLMMLGDVSGTGDAHTMGELLIVDDGTGELIATTGTPQDEPFMLLEDIAAPTADTLAHVIYAG